MSYKSCKILNILGTCINSQKKTNLCQTLEYDFKAYNNNNNESVLKMLGAQVMHEGSKQRLGTEIFLFATTVTSTS